MLRVANLSISNDANIPYVIKLYGDDARFFKLENGSLFFLLDQPCKQIYTVVVSIEDLANRYTPVRTEYTLNTTNCSCVPNPTRLAGNLNVGLTDCENLNVATITNTFLTYGIFNITGFVDDEVLFNGAIHEPGKYATYIGNSPCFPSMPNLSLNGAHNFSYSTILAPNQSIVVGVRDYGGTPNNDYAGGINAVWTITPTASPTTTTSTSAPTTTTSTTAQPFVYPNNIVSTNAIYTQSSVWNGGTLAATTTGMNNRTVSELHETGTGSSTFEWVKMTLDNTYNIKNIVIGCDFDIRLYGGWGPAYTQFKTVEYSLDDVNWTYAFNTETFSTPMKLFSVDFIAKYIRIRSNTWLAVTEFAAGT